MRKLLLCLSMAFLSFILVVNEASAKRFGGGRSFGVQRSSSSLFSQSPSKSFKSPLTPARNKNWGGILGGMLVGGLLASLFMSNGLGAGLLSWLVVGALIFFVFQFLKRKANPSYQSVSSSPYGFHTLNQEGFKPANHGNDASTGTEDFEQEQFLREAKLMFYRLQKANDDKNWQDLSSFTSPEVFAEIKMQMEERGSVADMTAVFDLKAELLNVEKQTKSWMASVRFSGLMQEDDAPKAPFEEIWHFTQTEGEQAWVLVGIQQEVL